MHRWAKVLHSKLRLKTYEPDIYFGIKVNKKELILQTQQGQALSSHHMPEQHYKYSISYFDAINVNDREKHKLSKN